MKLLSVLAVSALAGLSVAAPTRVEEEKRVVLDKRAAVTETATVGYATLNGGTSGGKGGPTTTVSTLAQFTAAVADDTARIVVVSGTISGTAGQTKIGSNKTVIGKDKNAKLIGNGVLVKGKKNVIIRNLTIQKVLAANGDALGIQTSQNVWIDHVDLSSDRDHDKDYYDGLLDITHGVDYVTVTNSYIHDHWKASLVGHSDSNSAEDKGHLTVTYANNYWKNLNSRGPSFRFGTGHIFNNFYETVSDVINTRQGAQLLVESNVFTGSKKPLYSTDAGFAVSKDNDFGGESNTALAGTLNTVPYTYKTLGSANVKAAVVGTAGATLKF
ncbi:putative pectate lyase A [Pseudovirgaria hyperparasitica]|uniref:pectate lyase n=1 Tax=Pseudovirgaria hyperparasitica TaxID=470096 RepID=A0A6A6VSN7_9PEZI|nr:putative pectate lyase A [Pseudovirgaria hyperparasitica]KAF2752796.1 putative pectate lyase A [Pseudovirgaria hyperparasitica]